MMIEHIAMGPLMLIVMLFRYEEYALPHAGHAVPSPA
jgi:hypothetical protein